MKKIKKFGLLLLILIGLFVQNACIAQSTGPNPAQAKILQFIDASFDLIKINNKGESFVDEKDKPAVSFNIGYNLWVPLVNGQHLQQLGKDSENSPESIAFDKIANNYNPEASNKTNGYFFLSFSPEFIGKNSNQTGDGYSTHVSLYYLELPILINYALPMKDNDGMIHFGIGVYAAAGLFGKFSGNGFSQSVKFGSSDNDDLKRMDYGIAINAGYSFLKKWDASINYDLGLRDVSATSPDPSTKISGFSLNIAYRIH